jgi:hypothetical protein
VRGHVYLNILTPVRAVGVFLKVKGYEKVHWRERRSRTHTTRRADGSTDTRTEYYYVDHDGHNSFFRCKIPLAMFNADLMPAQYAFAFSFYLPPGLPGSFFEACGDHTCRVCCLPSLS